MRKARIMIVDDDTEYLEELSDTMMANGYDVIAVNDSTTVMKIAYDTHPEVILLDLKMKNVNGFQLARLLMNFRSTAGIPVIAMTGYYDDREHDMLMARCGIKWCILKPFNPQSAMDHIDKVLRGNQQDPAIDYVI